MSTGKQRSKKPKKSGVLSGHKKEGKKFIPPMMQFGGFFEARWVHQMIPEFHTARGRIASGIAD